MFEIHYKEILFFSILNAESGGDSDKEEMDQQDDKSSSESESEDETKEDEEDSQTQSDEETDVGLKSLLEDLSSDKPDDKEKSESVEQCESHNEMDDVAALAESIQPKGNTLLTTSVSFHFIFHFSSKFTHES